MKTHEVELEWMEIYLEPYENPWSGTRIDKPIWNHVKTHEVELEWMELSGTKWKPMKWN